MGVRALGFVCLLLLLLPAAGQAEGRPHGTHGYVRGLCADATIRRWPAGPAVTVARSGEGLRRYFHRGAWAMVTTERRRKQARGYVLAAKFCPPSARGRAAMARDRALAGGPKHVRKRRPRILPKPLWRRVCAENVWMRDVPLNQPIGVLWRGDVVRAERSAANPWFGGMAFGHERKFGWVPRAALCPPLPQRPRGFSLSVRGAVTVLAPPKRLFCADALSEKRLLEVGVDFSKPVSSDVSVRAELVRGGKHYPGPTFTPGEAAGLSRGAVGPLPCGDNAPRRITVRYLRGDGTELARFGSSVGPAARPSAATAKTGWPPPSPGTACTAQPLLRYAHGHEGPVSHRYDARPALSADGSTVAFDTPLPLSSADHDRARDVYRWRDGRLTLLSAGSATSRAATISADGATVAYETDVPNPVPGVRDENRARDVVVRGPDGRTRVVSLRRSDGMATGNGRSRAPSLSGDGAVVAFESRARNLVPDAPDEGIYLASTGNRGPRTRLLVRDGYRPALSADGRVLVFESQAALVPGDTNRDWDVYAIGTRVGAAPRLVSARRGTLTRAADGRSIAGVPSADGRYVAFMSSADDVVRNDIGGLRDVFRRDLKTGRTVRISVDRCGGSANGYSRYPSISASGRYVAFDSHAEDIVAAPTHGEGEIFVRDVVAHRTRLASHRPDGDPARRTSFSPAISADGEAAAFPSFARDLTAGDDNGRVDQFLAALRNGGVRRLGTPAARAKHRAERWGDGPLRMKLLIPDASQRCGANGHVRIAVGVRYSRRALARPVREIRVLLQRPGSEAVIDRLVLRPARPGLPLRGSVASTTCRENFNLRYELMVGAVDRSHDHVSVTLRVHGYAAFGSPSHPLLWPARNAANSANGSGFAIP